MSRGGLGASPRLAGPRALRRRKNKVYREAEKPKQEKKGTCLYWLTFSRVSENKRYDMNDIRRGIALRSAARSAAPRPPLSAGAVPLRIFCRARASKLAPYLRVPARLPSALMLSVYHLPLLQTRRKTICNAVRRTVCFGHFLRQSRPAQPLFLLCRASPPFVMPLGFRAPLLALIERNCAPFFAEPSAPLTMF